MDTETRTARRIICDMEPILRTLCNGTDAAVAVAAPITTPSASRMGSSTSPRRSMRMPGGCKSFMTSWPMRPRDRH